MLRRLSFRARLLLWILPTLLLGLSALSFGIYLSLHRTLEAVFTQHAMATTARSADGINTWLKTLLLEPETIASTPAAKSINRDFKTLDLQNFNRHRLLHSKYPDIFLDIYAANRKGEYHTVREDGDRLFLFVGDIANRDYFRSIMAGGPAQVTPPLISRTTGVPTIFLVAPIRDDGGIPQGLIGAGISLSYVRVVAESLKAFNTGYGIVVARDGALIHHPDPNLILKTKLTESEDPSVRVLGQQMTSGASGVLRYTYRGQRKIAFYQPVPAAGWSVATVVPEAELFAPAVRYLRFMVLLTLVMVVGIGFILFFAAFHLTRPILRLASHAQLIADGNLNPGLMAVEREDEIGLLSRTFNIMVINLQREMGTIRTSERKYRSLVNSIGVGIYRSHALPDGRLVQANAAMVRMFGYASEAEMLDRPVQDLMLDPSDGANFCQAIAQAGSASSMELKFRRKDGSVFWCAISASAEAPEEGAPEWITGFIEDITEQKELTEQLRQSQKMEAIGTLAGGVAHDFNNLLTVILGYGHMLKPTLETDGAASRHLENLLAAGEKAGQLTRSLLAFSRKQIIDLKPANLNDIVDGMGKLLARLLGEDIHLVFDFHKEPLPVMVDVGPIEQVLLNLVTNARDAMPRGGFLSIGTELVHLSSGSLLRHQAITPGDYAVLSVSDNGCGMTEDVKRRIFEPFFSTKPVGQGTGLGLSILFGIVRQHAGDLSVYSEPGIGTTIKVYLPIVRHSGESQAIITPAPAKGGKETILIAEDNAEVRDLAVEVLASAGYQVLVAFDGEEAIRTFFDHANAIDLLLLDVVMPKVNGREVFEDLKTTRPGIKALFMSGYTADIISQKGILEEGLHYVSKPLTPETLLRKVREALDAP